MIVSLNVRSNISLIPLINNYKKELTSPTLRYNQVQKMADHLGQILQDHQELYPEIVMLLDEIEKVERKGQQNDQKLLRYFNQLDLELKQLELQLEALTPSVIEQTLKDLEVWLQSLQKKYSYQDGFFKKEIHRLQAHLDRLMFSFHFPLYEKIKNKKAPLLKMAMDLFLNRRQSVSIKDQSLEKSIEARAKKPVKELMKHSSSRQMLIPHFIVEHIYSQQTIG